MRMSLTHTSTWLAGIAVAIQLLNVSPVVIGQELTSSNASSNVTASTEYYSNQPAPAPGACPYGYQNATLNPEAEEGPYYLTEDLFRTNITEAQKGIPFQMRITILDTECNPVAGVYVDIWQCNATGFYSGYTSTNPGGNLAPDSGSRKLLTDGTQTDNSTFLRGTVLTDSNGVAVFDSILPGWYSGRAAHVHTKVHVPTEVGDVLDEADYSGSYVSHTGRFYFEDSFLDSIYQLYPYSLHTGTRTTLAGDNTYDIFTDAADDATTIFEITYVDGSSNPTAGLIGSVTTIIDPSANNTATSVFGNGQMGMGAMGPLASGGAPLGAMMTMGGGLPTFTGRKLKAVQ